MKRLLFFTVLCMGIAIFLAGPVCAAVTGPCFDCHTMHNSQDGQGMELFTGETGPFPSLTRGSCVGCHTGTNDGTNVRPFVYDATATPTYGTDTLAGGNFWWVRNATINKDAKGHNVKGIPGLIGDVALATGAPGNQFGSSCANSCHQTLYTPVAFGGGPADFLATGCEGCHLAPKHHAPQQTADTPALAANGFFRFLSSHENTSDGVEGIEDSDWQYGTTVGGTDHNEYLGHVNENSSGGFIGVGGKTMTAYCTGCHGNFHTQLDGSNWIRHPSDAVLPTTGEYTQYTVYDPIAPVARLSLAGGVSASVGSTDMVMCLSCHRAHGSPFNDMLRWDYEAGTIAGGGGASDGTGCFVCHTEKDN